MNLSDSKHGFALLMSIFLILAFKDYEKELKIYLDLTPKIV